jgi:hypothetical protein
MIPTEVMQMFRDPEKAKKHRLATVAALEMCGHHKLAAMFRKNATMTAHAVAAVPESSLAKFEEAAKLRDMFAKKSGLVMGDGTLLAAARAGGETESDQLDAMARAIYARGKTK